MTEAGGRPARGSVVWVDFDPVKGHEQGRRRPALALSSAGYITSVPSMLVVLPITTRDRGLPHHVLVTGRRTGLTQASFAMTEQPRTIDHQRVERIVGMVDDSTMQSVDMWLRDWLQLP